MTILTIPNPKLSEKALKVHRFDNKLKTLVAAMLEVMKQSNGIGLAATQLGISARVILVPILTGEVVAMCNPEIVSRRKDKNGKYLTAPSTEECLSCPGISKTVERFVKIEVKFQTFDGRTTTRILENLPSFVFQHELDHLNGITIADKEEYAVTSTESLQEADNKGRSELPA